MKDPAPRAEYESPLVTDYGTIEEVTKGGIEISLEDSPVGGTHVHIPVSLPVG